MHTKEDTFRRHSQQTYGTIPRVKEEKMTLNQKPFWQRLKDAPWPWQGWGVLKAAPRELWLIFLMKFLTSYAYYSVATNLTSFLTEEMDYSDYQAGWVYGTFGLLISVFQLCVGPVLDALGVRWALIAGAVVNTVSHAIIFMAKDDKLLLSAMYGFQPIAQALGVPVMSIAIRRYTNSTNRVLAYGLFVAAASAGDLISGNVTSLLLEIFDCDEKGCEGGNLRGVTVFGMFFSGRRVIFFTGAVTCIIMLIIAIFTIREIELDDEGNMKQSKRDTSRLIGGMKRAVRNREFYRLIIFSALIWIVKFVIRHLDATFPKYMKRSFDTELWGSIKSIHPLAIIFLTPLVVLYCQPIGHYRMIEVGSYITAASVFLVCINTVWASVLFVLLLSVGEAIYSPRVYDYSMAVSPKGEEGVFVQLASAPMFAAKFGVGPLSGWLLQEYCKPPKVPDTPACENSEIMWAIIGGISMTGPVLMTLLAPCISSPLALPGIRPYMSLNGEAVDEEAGIADSENQDTSCVVNEEESVQAPLKDDKDE
eukprot:Colp12_sorted_trinity150504_noHs@32239